MVIGGAVCSCGGCRGEEASFGTSLVGSLIHLGLHFNGWLSDRVSQLDDQIIIKVVAIWRFRLFRNTGPDDFAFGAFTSSGSRRLWN